MAWHTVLWVDGALDVGGGLPRDTRVGGEELGDRESGGSRGLDHIIVCDFGYVCCVLV